MLSGVEEATAALVARLREVGVVPVVELPRAEDGVPLAGALIAGGLSCVEITLRTPGALEGIAAIRAAYPEILLGAGTVLTISQLETAMAAGADFAVAPGTNPEIVEASLAQGLPILPGVSTPSDGERASGPGCTSPASAPRRAAPAARSLRPCAVWALPRHRVRADGVDHAGDAARLPRDPQVLACGGSWMVESSGR